MEDHIEVARKLCPLIMEDPTEEETETFESVKCYMLFGIGKLEFRRRIKQSFIIHETVG
jgi:hypothetical protein